MSEWISEAAQLIALLAEVVAIAFILIGILGALWIFVKNLLEKKGWKGSYMPSRIHLGSSLSLSLEFLIGADILKSAISPTWEDLTTLAAIVAIRTVLNFFLMKELQEDRSEQPPR